MKVSCRTCSALRRIPSALTRFREDAGGLEAGDVAGGGPVPDRVALVVQFRLVEEDGELGLAGAGAAVFALAVASGGFPGGHRDAGAVDHAVEHVRDGPRRHRDQFPAGDQG